jgi:PAS domain S-box-containing protein
MLEQASIGLHWVGADGIVLWANQAELDLLGYRHEEYIGHHIREFHEDPDAIDDILRRLSNRETLHNYEARLRCKHGGRKHVLISSNVLWSGADFIHTRCFTRDITDRITVEEALRGSEERYRAFVHNSSEGIWRFELDHPIDPSWTEEEQIARTYEWA